MDFYVLNLFPEMIENCFNASITGRATKNGLLSLKSIDIRDFSTNKYKKVDDYPCGGGGGIIIRPDYVYNAYEYAVNLAKEKTGKVPRVVYMTPQGEQFSQEKAKEFAEEESLIILCGHYEGIDERVLNKIVTDNISIGDYVLTGGELAACVVMDAVSRFVPGVLGNADSAYSDTFSDGLLEHPQYTKPEEFMGEKVPPVLLSGHHANIDKWRYEQKLLRTMKARPDLFDKYMKETPDIIKRLKKKHKDFYKEYIEGTEYDNENI